MAKESAHQLTNGDTISVHCAGGVGRTGTLTSGIVAALDLPLALVTDAEGQAETEQQRKLIASLQHWNPAQKTPISTE